ncbi:hypothetical protein Harman_01140 [Haloarcula mannanilytica]|uniref:Uncharacterized protein n=1 Tax=Haloarcula mannanilytica TaxID=2509225 RepID=A0A4C2EIU1_9EURY|nr:hypothetical protein [Haloarcula mannanilytica]GCF12179.1 hypothetical protein Harman_01140 [Haloarcula mannanilytica]
MNRSRVTLGVAAAVGLLLVAVGALVALAGTPEPAVGGPGVAGGFAILVGLLVALWKLWRTPGGPEMSPSPWADDEFVGEHLETTPAEEAVSGTDLAEHVEAAAAQARKGGTVAESMGPVREPLRATLIDALVQGGHDRDAVERQLAAGAWTDDPVAAAVLDEDVTPPDRSLRARLRAWLFPEKAVRQRSARAMAAVSAAADDALPSVVGQQAPRPVPVVAPGVADLQRAADGTLQRAVDGSLPAREAIGTGTAPDSRAGESATAENGAVADESVETEPSDSPHGPSETAREDGPDTTAADDGATVRADWGDVTEVRD